MSVPWSSSRGTMASQHKDMTTLLAIAPAQVTSRTRPGMNHIHVPAMASPHKTAATTVSATAMARSGRWCTWSPKDWRECKKGPVQTQGPDLHKVRNVARMN